MITIIIPSFNQKDYLAEAIESALNQTVLADDIIVVDDGSTDGSLEIARRYPVRVISQANKGLASARNTGIMNVYPFSDWVLPLDADDKLLPNAIEKIKEKIKEDPMVDVIGLSLRTFGTSDQEIILINDPKLEDFRTGNRLGCCSAIKVEAIKAVGGYSPKMAEGYEDLHLWINLLSKGSRIATIQEPVWMYRTKEESMWTEARKFHSKLIGQINKDFPEAQLSF